MNDECMNERVIWPFDRYLHDACNTIFQEGTDIYRKWMNSDYLFAF